jgi:hypothetical protein
MTPAPAGRQRPIVQLPPAAVVLGVAATRRFRFGIHFRCRLRFGRRARDGPYLSRRF